MKLYEMNVAMNDIYNMVMDESSNLNTLEDTLQCIEASVEEKVESGIKLIKSMQAFADSVKAEKEFQENRLKVLDNRIKRIKEYYKQNLEGMGKDKVLTTIGTMAVQKSTPSFKFDESSVPKDYFKVIPETYELDKEKIKADIKLGKEIPGVQKIQGTHLRIR